MKVLICGGGQVGLGIARQLTRENHDVTIVEESEENIRRIQDTLEVKAKMGFPSHPNVLEEAGIESTEMIIAVTQSDEVNMVICQIASSLFNVPIKIARVRNRNYLDPIWKGLYRKDHLPIDYIISPEYEVAKAVLNRLNVPGAMDSLYFGRKKLRVTEVRCGKHFTLSGMSLAEIKEIYPDLKMNIMAINRNAKPFLPKITDKILPGDELFFVTDVNDTSMAMSFFGHEEEEARRIVIVGGGNVGFMLAEMLSEDNDLKVKLVELDERRAEFVAEKLERTPVINGNSLDRDILVEAGIENTETLIAVTNDDEVNILTCLLAKKNGCKKTVCLINKGRSYMPLISTLGIDVDVNPRETTVSSILQHIRKGKVRAAHSLYSGMMEMVETEVVPTSTIIGNTVNDLGLPEDIRISAIVNKDHKVIIPDENTIIRENDRLLIICDTKQIEKVDEIFSDRMDYF